MYSNSKIIDTYTDFRGNEKCIDSINKVNQIMPEEITEKERVFSVLSATFKALFAVAFILAEGLLIALLGVCMVYAIIIFPLRKPIHNAINKLSSNINKQYGRLLESIAYEGKNKAVSILSWIGILLLRVATILFLGFWVLYFVVCFGFYSLFIPFLRQIVVEDVRGMYREIKNNFECIIAMISGGKIDDSEFLIGDERNRTRIIVGGIFKVPLRIGAIITNGYSIILLCACLIFTVWFQILREGTCGAIKKLGSRIGIHLKFITYVFLNKYPDFDIEGNYIEERHLKKDGTPDRRYRENK